MVARASICLMTPVDDLFFVPHLAQRLKWICVFTLFLATGCVSVPLDQPKAYSESIADNVNTHFGKLAVGWANANAGKSGFFPFQLGMDALDARLDMAEKADMTIDLQYLMMKDDATGSAIQKTLRVS